MTVLETIQRSAAFLEKKGVESPRLNAELLLADVLKLPRLKLYLEFSRELTELELTQARAVIQRRAQREPLQHILGSTSFCGLEIAVSKDALIPRPETELLVEAARDWLSTLPKDSPSTGMRALDFGAGSGCVAIALAVACPSLEIDSLDRSAAALNLARQNAARHGMGERLHFFEGESFRSLPERTLYDVIVSNPPYIPTAQIQQLAPEVRDFDPVMALDGGTDGFDFYRMFQREAAGFLKPGGALIFEIGDDQLAAVRDIFSQHPWRFERFVSDYNQTPRVCVVLPAK